MMGKSSNTTRQRFCRFVLDDQILAIPSLYGVIPETWDLTLYFIAFVQSVSKCIFQICSPPKGYLKALQVYLSRNHFLPCSKTWTEFLWMFRFDIYVAFYIWWAKRAEISGAVCLVCLNISCFISSLCLHKKAKLLPLCPFSSRIHAK